MLYVYDFHLLIINDQLGWKSVFDPCKIKFCKLVEKRAGQGRSRGGRRTPPLRGRPPHLLGGLKEEGRGRSRRRAPGFPSGFPPRGEKDYLNIVDVLRPTSISWRYINAFGIDSFGVGELRASRGRWRHGRILFFGQVSPPSPPPPPPPHFPTFLPHTTKNRYITSMLAIYVEFIVLCSPTKFKHLSKNLNFQETKIA